MCRQAGLVALVRVVNVLLDNESENWRKWKCDTSLNLEHIIHVY